MKKSLEPAVEPPPLPIFSELVVMSGTIENDISASTPLARFCRSSCVSRRPCAPANGGAAQASSPASHHCDRHHRNLDAAMIRILAMRRKMRGR